MAAFPTFFGPPHFLSTVGKSKASTPTKRWANVVGLHTAVLPGYVVISHHYRPTLPSQDTFFLLRFVG